MAMQTRRVAVVGKAKFGLCWTVFAGAVFARTGAIRFRFECGQSDAAGTVNGC